MHKTTMSETLIKVENVSKKFCRDLKRSLLYGMQDLGGELFGQSKNREKLRKKEFWALNKISVEMKRGESLGLIGRNGAGKSTLLKILNGLIKPDIGKVEMRGNVGALIELGAGFNPVLTGRENVYINGAVLGFSRREIEERLGDIFEFAQIGDFIDTPVQYYSSGMKVRLGFAVASQLKPDILLLDEVLAVGDEAFKKKCFDFLYHLQNQGTSFILVSHNPYAIERMCSHVLVLNKGEIAAFDEAKKAITHYHSLLGDEKKIVDKNGLLINPEERPGTGQIRIISTELLDNFGKDVNEIISMESCIFKLNFRVYEKLKGPRFTLQINSTSSMNLLTYVTYGVLENTDFEVGDYSLELEIPKLALPTDIYIVDVKVGRNVRLDTFNSALKFKTVLKNEGLMNLTGGLGLFINDGKWKLK